MGPFADTSEVRGWSGSAARALILALGALGAWSASAADETPRVVVLTSSRQSYRDAAEAAVQHLDARRTSCELVLLSSDDARVRAEAMERLRTSTPDVIITSGATLTDAVLETIPNTPIVSLMTPNALDSEPARGSAPERAGVVVVTSDVAPREQVDWIRATQPECRRVAVLCSDNSERTARALRDAGRASGVELVPVQADRDRFPAAIETLNRSGFDGVLMIPDSKVYNSPNVQRLLLWGLRQRHAVWAFSDNVVKAGALAGIASDPAQVGKRGAELAIDLLHGKRPTSAEVVYPQKPVRAINVRTAEMIGVRFSRDVLASGATQYGEHK